MIIARSPLRISLGGGGTDLPSYYEKHGGFVISSAIDRYIYITLHESFSNDLVVKYSEMERVPDASQLKHPIFREAFSMLGMDGRGLEITSIADIPSGTGLGSSSSFTTALLKVLHTHKGESINARNLAAEACHLEMERMKQPIGTQDQHIAAYGGIKAMEFLKSGSVAVWNADISLQTINRLESNLLLFFTGYSRSASSILSEQDTKSKTGDADMMKNLHFVKETGKAISAALESGNLNHFGGLMDIHWLYKKRRSNGMSNPKIDHWYDQAMANGALGGKLIGAGGGGFLMFYSVEPERLRAVMAKDGLREVRLKFDFEGTKIIHHD